MLIAWSHLVCLEQPEGEAQSLGMASRIVRNVLCVQSHACHKHTYLNSVATTFH